MSPMRTIRGLMLLTAMILLGLVPRPASAQSGAITGVVVDGESGLTLGGVSVLIPSLQRGSVTSTEGRFAILGVPAGTHEVEVEYIGYASERQSASVRAGGVAQIRFELRTEVIAVKGVTVIGQRIGQAAALNQQLNAPNITNVVAADQIGRFPDANIGDAMKRIPGFTVMGDQGEARYAIIRGMESQLNSVTLNGERIPSAEAGTRAIQLDLVPADMVKAVEVNKAITPDMDADAIGASVNIVTRSAPETRRISATAGSGYNFLGDKPLGLFSGVYADRFLDGKLGFVANGSYYDHKGASDNVEVSWENPSKPYASKIDVRRYDVDRLRQSVGLSLDYKLGERSTIAYSGIFNHRNDWEIRYQTNTKLGAPDANGVSAADITKQLKTGPSGHKGRRLEDQRTQSHALSGEHLFGAAAFDWSLQWAKASQEKPDEEYIAYRNKKGKATVDLSNPETPYLTLVDASAGDPSKLAFNKFTWENEWTRDLDKNARADLRLPMRGGMTELQIGGRYRDKSKLQENNFYDVIPLSGFSSMADATLFNADRSSAFLAGSGYRPGMFPTTTWIGSQDVHNTSLFKLSDNPAEYVAGNFDATERISAGYLMVTQKLGEKTSMVAGVRAEHTAIDYNGFQFNEDTEASSPTSATQSYTNLFPSLSFRFDLGNRRVLRAALTNAIARPNYEDLVPYRNINQADETLSLGNPDLNPTKSMNLDVMYEQYFSSVGMFSAGAYYKDITDFIYGYEKTDAVDPVSGVRFHHISQPQNGASASLYGVEVSLQRELAYGFSIYGNYSFTNSSVDGFPITTRANEDLPLPGTSKHTLNASLSYDDARFSFRTSLNFQDKFLDPDGGVGDSTFYDRWYDSATTVDVNGEVVLTRNARFFFSATNLTNQPLRYYQGIPDRTSQAEYYNAELQSGIKINLR